MGKTNTVYIMSKGRPDCITAQNLIKIGYKGDWFIVCGDNDETIPQYQKNFGIDKILIFNWREYAEAADLMDNFGLETKPSGAVPARNAIADISRERSETRHWQLDDDIRAFYYLADGKKYKVQNGAVLENILLKLSQFGEATGLADVGMVTNTFALPSAGGNYDRHVYCVHNMRSDSSFVKWRGRLSDDVVQEVDVNRFGLSQFAFSNVAYEFQPTATLKGGNADLYSDINDALIKKVGYELLCCPVAIGLREKSGAFRHIRNFKKIAPKIVAGRYERT